MVEPPVRLPFARPAILWLFGLFAVAALDGRGKLSATMALISLAYLLLLPAYILAAVVYNLFALPRRYRSWENTFACRRCGRLIETHADAVRPDSAKQSYSVTS